MTDEAKALVERLRERIADTLLAGLPYNRDGYEAADRIEALEAENERMREALTMIAHHIRDESDPYEEDYWGCRSIARAALAGDSHD